MRATSLWHSFQCAFTGLWYLLHTQRNARIHLVIAILIVPAGIFCQLVVIEWAILMLSIGIVITAEALNTAIETLVDLASPELHPLAAKAKDVAAAAVLLSAVTALIVGAIVLGPPLWRILCPV